MYAERTGLLQRSQPTDSLLPYAVLLEEPRAAGKQVVQLIEVQLREPGVSGQWHTLEFLTWPRLIVRMLAVLMVAGVVAAVALLPARDVRSPRFAVYSGDISGSASTQVGSVDTIVELARSSDGRAQLRVTERLTVLFSDQGARIPQFVHQWPLSRDGQLLDLRVGSLVVDGHDAPFGSVSPEDSRALTTVSDGIRSYILEPTPNEHGAWLLYLTLDDLGASLDFPAGTFVGPMRTRCAGTNGWSFSLRLRS